MQFKNEVINKLRAFQNEIKNLFNDKFSNLTFLISPSNGISVWVKNKDGSCGAGITLDKRNTILEVFDEEFFAFLNKKVALASLHPDKYFYCSECGRVLDREQFAANVFAGYYCKECAKKPEIAELIEESKKVGFYD